MCSCNYSPGNTPGVVNVASTDQDDYISGMSNWGDCLTVGAPGENIIAAMKPVAVPQGPAFTHVDEAGAEVTSYAPAFTAETTVVNGTSFAAAIVAGVAAVVRQFMPAANVSVLSYSQASWACA
eukprot:tig00021038_g17495.t1